MASHPAFSHSKNIAATSPMKPRKTTQSSRKHAFLSFRERVDAVKIDPSRDLRTRAYDDADTSHFLSTLEHWKEINISKNFTEFLDKVEIHSQSLPQILYHQKLIYSALQEHIKVNDPYSIQPLLELLAQFIHDLGPDFMPYYIDTLNLLMEIALSVDPNELQNSRNPSNALEWTFNCMAFAFKYLSKILSKDLLQTFKALLPLLSLNTKKYISRYCAEALSFLVRKSKEPALESILAYSLNDQEAIQNEAYCQSIIIMYSECIKSTKGSFHSKSPLVFSKILNNAISQNMASKHISIVCDIILSVMNHGTVQACDQFYQMAIAYMHKILDEDATLNEITLLSVVQILITLSFAESGKKITSWAPLMDLVEKVAGKLDSKTKNYTSSTLYQSIVYMLVVSFRNCSLEELTKRHLRLFKIAASLGNGDYFFAFAESSKDICGSRMTTFGLDKFIQDFVNNNCDGNDSQLQKLTFFMMKNPESKIIISNKIQSCIQEQLESNYSKITGKEMLFNLYWRLLILKFSSVSNQTDAQYKYLMTLLAQIHHDDIISSPFAEDIVALIVELLNLQCLNNPSKVDEISTMILNKFDSYKTSHAFVTSFNKIVNCMEKDLLAKCKDNLLLKLAQNLGTPNHEVRAASIKLAMNIYERLELDVPDIYLQINVIESIPLSLHTGRDLSSRIRSLGVAFEKLVKPSDELKQYIVNFMFGLLTNKFQPCWLAVFESLPLLQSNCSKEIWEIGSRFLTMNYNSQNASYTKLNFTGFDDEVDMEDPLTPLSSWFPTDTRIVTNFHSVYDKVLQKYDSVFSSILEEAESIRGPIVYEEMMRSQALQAYSKVPYVAEAHSEVLVPLVLHESDVEETEDESPNYWNLKDRNALVGLFAKFKNMKTVYKSEVLHSHLLKLLCNKQLSVQKMSLEVLLNWKNASLNKYRDNLLNLLDDTIFRDEIAKFITMSNDSTIEQQDLDALMPYVLRILFGRAQGSPKSNSHSGRKFAVVTVLPNLGQQNIIEFLKLGSDRIEYSQTYQNNDLTLPTEVSLTNIRRINGFVRLLSDVYDALGSQYAESLSSTIKPLVYSLAVAQNVIGNQISCQNDDHVIIEKSARNVRQVGMRCLNQLFELLGPKFDWNDYKAPIFEHIIKPRLSNFTVENLQSPSFMMKLIASWITSPSLIPFLYLEDYTALDALLGLLENQNTKDEVLLVVLNFASEALTLSSTDNDFFTLIAKIVDVLLSALPKILDRSSNHLVNTKVLDILLILLSKDYVDDNETKGALIESLTRALDKPESQINSKNKVNVFKSLSSLISGYDCSWGDIESLYEACSKSFRTCSERSIRKTLVTVFQSFGARFTEVEIIGDLLENLNAYTNKRFEEPDFEKRLGAFKKINEELYSTLTTIHWLPILNCCLFFINDVNELAIRTNATFTLNRFTDSYSQKESLEDAKKHIHLLKNTVLPNIRNGLRKSAEVVQTEYINVLEYLVTNSKFYEELDDMKVLLFNNDEEANFFRNINHIQLHRRQRAIIRLRDFRNQLSDSSISHYILPIIEHYAICSEEKFRNIANETVETISFLVRCVSWNQYRALFRRYVSNLKKSKVEELRDHVALIVALSGSLLESKEAFESNSDDDILKHFPKNAEEVDSFVTEEAISPLSKILGTRDDDTIVYRIRLAEALTNFVKVLSKHLVEAQLPGILTSTCQVLRSRSEELRDAVRKSLGRMAKTLGASYFKFILQELKSSLSRGSQIHVLSFTLHTLIVTMQGSLKYGDLDESTDLVVNVIMEDIFGAAGQEKDADGYTSKMKEVKHHKSYDTGELLSANITLPYFGKLITPIKMLLQENVSLKIQNKLDELMRRYALGLNHNEGSSSQGILFLCYELHNQAEVLAGQDSTRAIKKDNNKDSHFLVKLNAKSLKTQVEYGTYISTLQKFSFDLLRTALTRHENLRTIGNVTGFVPLLENGLQSPNEGVVISCLKLLILIIRLPFDSEAEEVFKRCSRKALNIIKDCPSTNSELCQACLKFLATVIRHKPDIKLKETAISYLLVRIQPDLEEPNRQGLAFSFVKAVLSQHIMVAEIYDTMDRVAKIMITNHTKEIRDMSRSAYFQFLMEYDQGKGRLEKQFKFLLNNLSYSTQDGRQSVMELLHLIIQKSGTELLKRLASSFFIGLANVAVSDDTPKCREMASTLISNMIKKLGADNLTNIVKFCASWLDQTKNVLLQRCGLMVYKIYCSEVGFGQSKILDELAFNRISEILEAAKNDSDSEVEVDWEAVYTALSVFTAIAGNLKRKIFAKAYSKVWFSIIDCLLYPHSWVRLSSCRLVGILLNNLDDLKFDLSVYELQTIAFKLLHQMGAPSIAEDLGVQIVKNLALIAMKWNKDNTPYEYRSKNNEGEEEEEQSVKYQYALEYLVTRVSAIMRQETNYRNSFVSKKSSIQLAALIVQIIPQEKLADPAEKILLGLYNFSEMNPNNSDQENELANLSRECTDIIEKKLGVTEYTSVYTKVKQVVNQRRQERRTKRAQLSITAPDVAARRKRRKHERFRENRRQVKDDNGYYRKKSKFN